MKYVVIAVIVAITWAALYAGNAAIRSWRASVAVRVVRLQRVEQ